MLHRLTARERSTRPVITGLTAVLLDEAESGDDVARGIVVEHGRALGDFALAAGRRVGIELSQPFTLILTGGVLRHPSTLLADEICERVRHSSGHAEVCIGGAEPALGSLNLALAAQAVPISDAVRTNLRRSIPSGRFFDTLTQLFDHVEYDVGTVNIRPRGDDESR